MSVDIQTEFCVLMSQTCLNGFGLNALCRHQRSIDMTELMELYVTQIFVAQELTKFLTVVIRVVWLPEFVLANEKRILLS